MFFNEFTMYARTDYSINVNQVFLLVATNFKKSKLKEILLMNKIVVKLVTKKLKKHLFLKPFIS